MHDAKDINIKQENVDSNFKIMTNGNQFNVSEENHPILLTKFKKPGGLNEFLIMLIPMVSGATNIRFSLSENGEMALIKYNWPRPMYDFSGIFNMNKGDDVLKVLALEELLVNHRITANETPECKISINLPFPVQTNTSERVVSAHDGVDGSKVLRIELAANTKPYATAEIEIKFKK